MYKNIKYQFLVACFTLVLISCSEDLGNYDYVDINEVDFLGFQEEYTAKLGDTFIIEPTLEFTQDTSGNEGRYEYKWFVIRYGVLPVDARFDLSSSKNLVVEPVSLLPGDYTLIYEVKDLDTGVEWQKRTKLNVVSTIFEGWMVLNEVNGGSRLDMISLIDGKYTPIHDVLAFTDSSLKLEGHPVEVETYSFEPQFYGIYVTTTGNGTTKIHPETFNWEEPYRLSYEAVAKFPTDFGADFIKPVGHGRNDTSSYMYKDGDVYYYHRGFETLYGSPINVINGLPFEAAPFMGINPKSGDQILYDNTNKKFVRHIFGYTNSSELPEGTLFDYKTGKELIYMEGTPYNQGEIFAILKDPTDSKLNLIRISSSYAGVNQVYYEEIPALIAADMDMADHFAINPDFGYLFYSLNGKVYEYDFTLKTSKLMLDRPGQEITLLAFDPSSPKLNSVNNPDGENYRNKLVVGRFNPTSTEGTFELYNVPPVNGNLILYDSWEGFGRIVSESYRTRF